MCAVGVELEVARVGVVVTAALGARNCVSRAQRQRMNRSTSGRGDVGLGRGNQGDEAEQRLAAADQNVQHRVASRLHGTSGARRVSAGPAAGRARTRSATRQRSGDGDVCQRLDRHVAANSLTGGGARDRLKHRQARRQAHGRRSGDIRRRRRIQGGTQPGVGHRERAGSSADAQWKFQQTGPRAQTASGERAQQGVERQALGIHARRRHAKPKIQRGSPWPGSVGSVRNGRQKADRQRGVVTRASQVRKVTELHQVVQRSVADRLLKLAVDWPQGGAAERSTQSVRSRRAKGWRAPTLHR